MYILTFLFSLINFYYLITTLITTLIIVFSLFVDYVQIPLDNLKEQFLSYLPINFSLNNMIKCILEHKYANDDYIDDAYNFVNPYNFVNINIFNNIYDDIYDNIDDEIITVDNVANTDVSNANNVDNVDVDNVDNANNVDNVDVDNANDVDNVDVDNVDIPDNTSTESEMSEESEPKSESQFIFITNNIVIDETLD